MNDLTSAASYIVAWFKGSRALTAQESDAFWRYLEVMKPALLHLPPMDAHEAAKEYFAYELPKWRASHPGYVTLSDEELWKKLDNHYYGFLREWRLRPSRARREVVCSRSEAPERTEENTLAMEERDVSSGSVAALGAPEALEWLRSLYQLPSAHFVAAEGGIAGAMIVRLLMRRLPPARTLELLLRILITHPLSLPSDLKRYRKPMVAHIAKHFWSAERKDLPDQNTVAEALGVSAYEISTAKKLPDPVPVSANDVEQELNALEVALDQEWLRAEGRILD